MRELCRSDLYFLLRYPLGRKDIEVQWLFERCREVQANPNGYLDLWSREHYKSSIITIGKTIQDVLSSHGDDPLEEWGGKEITVGIFSHTRPIAKGFLRQIMRELETNRILIDLFPEILWANAKKEAPKWSEDDGIIVKRKTNPKESTIEAWGIVEGQPTSKHFGILLYDDIVTQESVRSPEMMKKTTDSWALSNNLGVRGGIERYAGTFYHFNDTYREIIRRGAAIPRIHPATKNGLVDGEPVLLTREELITKKEKQGMYVFGCQMLLDPKADSTQGFKTDWINYYRGEQTGVGMNIYIIVDPANEKTKKSDYTSMTVWGAASDKNLYKLDMVRDKLNLTERTAKLFEIHRKWSSANPNSKIRTGYEKYGKDSDIQHIEGEMENENYRFSIEPLGGPMGKNDRIRRMVPDYESGKVWMMETLDYKDWEGKTVDLVKVFIEEEYEPFPVAIHDDMMDSDARIKDMGIVFPLAKPVNSKPYPLRKRGSTPRRGR